MSNSPFRISSWMEIASRTIKNAEKFSCGKNKNNFLKCCRQFAHVNCKYPVISKFQMRQHNSEPYRLRVTPTANGLRVLPETARPPSVERRSPASQVLPAKSTGFFHSGGPFFNTCNSNNAQGGTSAWTRTTTSSVSRRSFITD